MFEFQGVLKERYLGDLFNLEMQLARPSCANRDDFLNKGSAYARRSGRGRNPTSTVSLDAILSRASKRLRQLPAIRNEILAKLKAARPHAETPWSLNWLVPGKQTTRSFPCKTSTASVLVGE